MLVGIFTITLMFGAYETKKTNEKTVATVALSVTNKVIVIDAGHGSPDRSELLATME